MGLLNQTAQSYYDGDDYGNYQFVSLTDIINQFMLVYVGEDKIIPKAKRLDVAFHAQRALAELSFDTLKSCKAQEITVPATLQMTLPQDYVNYTKISWVDSAGIKHLMYPTSKTSNPSPKPLQDSDGDFKLHAVGTLDETSQVVVLDKEYKNILVGMTVSGPNIPIGTVVGSTSNLNSITTISLVDIYMGTYPSFTIALDILDSNAVLPTYTGTETLTFAMFPEPHPSNEGSTAINENLIVQEASAVILEGNTWALGSFNPVEPGKITASSVSEAAKVSVGMYVSHTFFTPGTKVIDVNGAVITTDIPAHEASTITTHGATPEITFFSTPGDSTTWTNYKSATPSENQDDYQDDTYWPMDGERYGLDPQYAQANGSFYVDCISGKIHFSSNISGKTVVLDYISDSLGTDEEMQVHKFAEEAMYRWILHAIASSRIQTQQLVPRLKKEKSAAIRTAKLRLSNIKLEELTQILRGKSKQIKH